ncbi:MAG TPA: hypothetical protein VMQ51_19615 [Candidatus Binatia bacterium]|nr:hypothetical protein [Candidatus Binatia bacterium]
MLRAIVTLTVLLLPTVAGAQSAPTPTAPVHPAFPWGLGVAIPTGQLLRDVWIEPQTVVVDTLVPVPPEPKEEPQETSAMAPPTEPAPATEPQYAVLRQTVVVPGYWVRQTTAGDYYPQRWMLEQVAPGNYRWRLLPAEVRNAR